MILYKINKLSKKYGKRQILKDLSFELSEGLFLISGPSGIGKSTLINILLGKEKEDSVHEFIFNKINLTDSSLPKRRNNILQYVAYCGQEASLLYNLSLEENRKLAGKDLIINFFWGELISGLNFEEFRNTRIHLLSGGQRQKAELIFCLSQKKSLFLCDEAFSALDADSRKFIHDFIMMKKISSSIIIVDHSHLFKESELSGEIDLKEGVEKKRNINENTDLALESSRAHINITQVLKEHFRFSPLSFVIRIVLNLFVLFFFSLGIAFINFRSSNQTVLADALDKNPFEYHQITDVGKEPMDDLLWGEYLNGNAFESIKFSYVYQLQPNDGILLSSNRFPDDIIYYYSNLFDITNNQNIGGKQYTFEKILDRNILPNFIEAYKIFDKKDSQDLLLISSPRTFNDLLAQLTNASVLLNDFIRIDLPYYLSGLNGDALYFNKGFRSGSEEIEIVDSNDDLMIVPDKEVGTNISIFNNEFPLSSVLNNKVTNRGSTLSMSFKTLKDIYMHMSAISKNQDSFYSLVLPKEALRKFSPDNYRLDFDLEKDTTASERIKAYAFFSIAGGSLLILIVYAFITKKGRQDWIRSTNNALLVNGLSQTKILLINEQIQLFYLIPLIVISVSSYLTWMPFVSNYLTMAATHTKPEGYYFYSLQPSYDYYDTITSPIKMFVIDPHYLYIFLIVAVLILINAVDSHSRKK